MATKTLHLSLVALSLLQGILAVRFTATNNASATPGGQRFDREIGTAYTLTTMPKIASFIWKIFGQATEAERRHYYPNDVVNLYVQDLQDGALGETGDNNVYMSAKGIETYPPGDATRFMFTSILYHEMTHIFQWSGKGTAPGGLTEGFADYVVLKSPFYVEGYSTPGEGSRWDEGYGVTSRFLEYCDGLREGFAAELNKKMREVYKEEYWKELLGKDVDQLWEEYKAKYSNVPASLHH
ncbi:uncharacterized protein LOC131016118 [Salvia miltiorrhiza]|uniref:uncharacterized protein LOC131016118 n=1 Tax=Salvia miltiorrhiza TaxID=226208 RepID=UPI0025AD6CF3|nr:uncharacterized protein LOC131016118 [Salvia miltiorrhiza]